MTFFSNLEFVTSDKMNYLFIGAIGGVAESVYKSQQATGFENGDTTFAEKTTDTNGLQNTINTTSTTLNFNTNRYELGLGPSGNPLSLTLVDANSNAGTNSTNFGIRFTPNNDLVIKSVNKPSGDGATTCSISTAINGTGTVLESVSYVGNVATFQNNITLSSGTQYYIQSGSTTNVVRRFDSSVSFPITDTNVTVTAGTEGNSVNTSRLISIESISTDLITQNTTGTLIQDTNTIPITTGTNGLVLHYDSDIPTNTNIRARLSDGTNNTSYVAIDKDTKKINIAKGSLTNVSNLTVETELSTTDISVTPTFKGNGGKSY